MKTVVEQFRGSRRMGWKPMPLERARRGFTLIELVVALGMVAVMAGSLYAAVRVSYRAQASSEAAVEPARLAEVAMMMIRADLENAVPPGTLAQGMTGVNSSGSLGDADEVTVYTTAPAPERASANGDIKEVILMVGTPENSTVQGQCLLRKVNRNLLSQNTPVYDEQILARGVVGFNLRYWDGTDWVEDFEGGTQSTSPLPLAVEVVLDIEHKGKRQRYLRVFRILCATGTTSTTGVQ